MNRGHAIACTAGTIAGVLSFSAVLFAWLLYDENTTEELDTELYCDMVRLHKEFPSLGWPDYRGSYAKDCKPPPRTQAPASR